MKWRTVFKRLEVKVLVILLSFLIICGISSRSSASTTSYMKYDIPISPSHKLYDSEIRCLSKAILREATGLDYKSKARVAQTVLNRSNSSSGASTICSTVYMKRKLKSGKVSCDFSWVCNNKLNNQKISFTDRQTAVRIAQETLAGKYAKLTHATHFVHKSVVKSNSKWIKNMKALGCDSAHCFYMNKPKR